MQVIYAHFMRTHILSNLLCALVIWLSFKLRKSQSWQLLVLVGLISGLGAATRYPVGIIVVIPCLYLLFDGGSDVRSCRLRFAERAKHFVASQVWLIGLGFGIGLFLGHPMLFLDPSSVTQAISNETLRYAAFHEFSGSQLLNSVCSLEVYRVSDSVRNVSLCCGWFLTAQSYIFFSIVGFTTSPFQS